MHAQIEQQVKGRSNYDVHLDRQVHIRLTSQTNVGKKWARNTVSLGLRCRTTNGQVASALTAVHVELARTSVPYTLAMTRTSPDAVPETLNWGLPPTMLECQIGELRLRDGSLWCRKVTLDGSLVYLTVVLLTS